MFGKSTRGKRLKSNDRLVGDLPFVTAGERNEGISDFVSNALAIFSKNTITIDMFGSAKYRNYNYGADDHISVVHTEKIPTCAAVFVCSAIHKVSYTGKFDYGRNFYPKDADDLKICLPIKNGKVDFDCMESFIADLEAQRIAALEAYLVAAGLKDYHLTTAEQKALRDYESNEISWQAYEFKNIFDKIEQGRRLKKDDQIEGDIPFVMAGVTNTGVVNHISNPIATFPQNSITIDIFGNTFYRGYNFGAGDDTGVYWSQKNQYSKEQMLFFATVMEQSVSGRFSYGDKLRSSQSLDFKMQLPTKNQTPDYAQMAVLISAIQKLVIKDVVCYVDQKIAASRGA